MTTTMTNDDAIILDSSNFDVRTHNGMVTMHNPATGQHRTFKVETMKDDAKFAAGKRVVRLLIGPDREDYTNWVAFAFADDRGVKVWRKFEGGDHEAFARMLNEPARWAARGVEYLVEARCRRCNRALTHPESIASGLGPVCEGR